MPQFNIIKVLGMLITLSWNAIQEYVLTPKGQAEFAAILVEIETEAGYPPAQPQSSTPPQEFSASSVSTKPSGGRH
jgi:hypothetical protein